MNSIFWLLEAPTTQPLAIEARGGKHEPIICPLHEGHKSGVRRIGDLSVVIKPSGVKDFTWTWMSDTLVSPRVLDVFARHHVTGFTTANAEVAYAGSSSATSSDLRELIVTGWGGSAASAAGVALIESCPGCRHKKYTIAEPDRLIDAAAWDGSDIFIVWPLPKFRFVSDRLAKILRREKVSGVKLIPATDRLDRDLEQKIARYRQAGRDPLDLFDSSKPEYVGQPEALLPYIDSALIQIASKNDSSATTDTIADKQTDAARGADSESADFGPLARLLVAYRAPQQASPDEPLQAGIPRVSPKVVFDALRWLWSKLPKLPPRTPDPPPRSNQLPIPPILPPPPADPTLEHLQRVDAIVDRIGKLIRGGASEEARARILNQERRDIGIKYKDLSPDALREYIYQVNKERYGDPLGPSYDFMRQSSRNHA